MKKFQSPSELPDSLKDKKKMIFGHIRALHTFHEGYVVCVCVCVCVHVWMMAFARDSIPLHLPYLELSCNCFKSQKLLTERWPRVSWNR